jgi:hypothetical protein
MQIFDKVVWKWRKDVAFTKKRIQVKQGLHLGKNSTETYWYWTAERTKENV